MEEDVKKKLEEKAIEVSNYLNSIDILHTYRLIEYGINFTLRQGWKEHILSISYSPSKKRWKPYAVDDWVKDAIIPAIQHLCGNMTLPTKKLTANTNTSGNMYGAFPGEVHFAEARACLSVLEPFAEENIDFSIICEFAQRGIRLVLNDPRCTHLDRTSLLETLEHSLQSDFSAAKEYLSQCLILCGVTES